MRFARSLGFRLPFLNGVYVAVDAIPRTVVVIDGPYCASTKALMQMAHNLRSDLLPATGRARVVPTLQTPEVEEVDSLALDRTAGVEAVFRDVAGWPDVDAVFASSFDFAQLLNFPLSDVARSACATKLVCPIPSGSLGGDWLAGYAGTCAALARSIPLAPAPEPDTVSIVGHLMDRTEPDQLGNVAEMRRLLEAIGLSVTSVWLSGDGITDLARVARSSLIVSLPFAREAASLLGRRLEIPVVACDLPLGLSATGEFLEAVGTRTDRADRAAELADREAAAAVGDVQTLADRCVVGRPLVLRFDNDPLRQAVRRFCADLGAPVHDFEDVYDDDPLADAPSVPAGLEDAVVLSTTFGNRGPALPHVPFGYPNYVEHPITPRPFLGYAGFRSLVERIATAALRHESGW